MSDRYVSGIARTNKLWCTSCSRRIRKGEKVMFLLDICSEKPMKEAHCVGCSEEHGFDRNMAEEDMHPFSSDALGQT